MRKKVLLVLLTLTVIFTTAACKNKKINEENNITPSTALDNKENYQVEDKLDPRKEEKKDEAVKEEHDKSNTTKNNNISVLVDEEKLDKTERNWWYTPKKNGEIPLGPKEGMEYNKKYMGYYLGDTTKKYIYLTFDEGYENGYTPRILDILKKEGVHAGFFVTTPYIKEHPELVKRMVEEGHVVGNHSTTHPSMAQVALKGKGAFNKEFLEVENEFKKVTGRDIDKFFRPPMGVFSETSMYYTALLGYKSIFWSFAYGDYDANKQPDPIYAKNLIIERTHNAGIYLLHAMSKTNTDILEEIIGYWKSQGFQFKSLNDL